MTESLRSREAGSDNAGAIVGASHSRVGVGSARSADGTARAPRGIPSSSPALNASVARQIQTQPTPRTERIPGLDTLRWIAAFIVVVAHVGLLRERDFESTLLHLIQIVVGLAFNGPFAVIVFFVVSGAVIHRPQVNGRELDVRAYLVRRFFRIVPPMVIAYSLYAILDVRPTRENPGLFWSLLCELGYYLLYPALLRFRRRGVSWIAVTLPCYVVILALVVTHQDALLANHSYVGLGLWTILLGLPNWILGCWLAEAYDRVNSISSARMWEIRSAVLGLSTLLMVLQFHVSGVLTSYVVTLTLAGPLICGWILLESGFRRNHEPPRLLEWLGSWSYSLYLLHPIALALMLDPMPVEYGAIPQDLSNPAKIAAGLVVSFGFFLVVERPSHALARQLGVSRRDHGSVSRRPAPNEALL
jgi:peptidoglycan/LPS O-acetylase OafA/YrhL